MLAAGTGIGPYEVTALLGAGGMGEVYRARDTRLKRDVAIKVLPETFAHDQDRLARFQREAELLATLNHPNIAAVCGFEEADGHRAIVLELVEAETLAERIARSGGSEGPPLRVTDVRRGGSSDRLCRSTKRCRSRSKSPRRSKPPTSEALFIGT